MAKVLKNDQCPDCMEFLALVKGAPLSRIACANCQQAKQDLPGKARSGHGSQLRAALRALSREEVVVMPDTSLAVSPGFTCPECGKTCATKEAFELAPSGACDDGSVHARRRRKALSAAFRKAF